jgi:hypothetical protein
MPLFLDGPGAERVKRALDAVLGGSQKIPPPAVPPDRPGVQRGLKIYSGDIFEGYHYAELLWRDEIGRIWRPFDPQIFVWALGTAQQAFAMESVHLGTLVGIEDWSTLDLAVFVVEPGGGGATAPNVPVVLVTSATPDVNGYYDGLLQLWDVFSRVWVNGAAVKIKDANA